MHQNFGTSCRRISVSEKPVLLMTYEFHPLTKLFSIMPEHERDELGQDIKANGQQVRIVLYEGKIWMAVIGI